MGTIIWFWLIPVLALVPALVWASWAARTGGRPDMRETTEQYARWQAILGRVQAAPAAHGIVGPGSGLYPSDRPAAVENRTSDDHADRPAPEPDAPGPARRSVS